MLPFRLLALPPIFSLLFLQVTLLAQHLSSWGGKGKRVRGRGGDKTGWKATSFFHLICFVFRDMIGRLAASATEFLTNSTNESQARGLKSGPTPLLQGPDLPVCLSSC